MNRLLLIIFLLIMMTYCGLNGHARENADLFTPLQYDPDSVFVSPLHCLGFGFAHYFVVGEKKTAYVSCDGEIVAKSDSLRYFDVSLDDTKTHTSSFTYIFDRQYLLKDRHYEFHFPHGVVMSPYDSTLSNDEIVTHFYVPADMGEHHFDFGNIDMSFGVIDKMPMLSCNWEMKVFPFDSSEWVILRNGVEVRRCPVDVPEEYGQISAKLSFQEYPYKDMHFENDIHFSIILPEGAVHTYRTDIVNKEARIDFMGTWEEELIHPEYSDYKVSYDDANQVDAVSLFYEMEIKSIGNKPIRILSSGGEIIAEKLPSIINVGGKSVIEIKFEDMERINGGVIIEIESGTLVTAKGDIAVNPTQRLTVGMSCVPVITASSDEKIYDLNGNMVKATYSGNIYVKRGGKYIVRN